MVAASVWLAIDYRAIVTTTLDVVVVVVVVVVVDSHIQRIVLATEKITVTQQVSHSYQMPIPLVVTKRYEGQRVTSW